MAALRTNLQRIGLDLPFVVAAGMVVYVVLFQRLSAAVIQMPILRLWYSQPALWRAHKCFDELRQLARWAEGHMASPELEDLEVTLRLATTQHERDFKEHHVELVGARLTSAAAWGRYYSGFCFLTFGSIIFIVAAHPGKRGLLLPIGLLLAALVARCGWEGQIERAVVGRLRFAIDCFIISGAKQREEAEREEVERKEANWHEREYDNLRRVYGPKENLEEMVGASPEGIAEEKKRLRLELRLAAGLLRLPPPCLPYGHFWALHYARCLWPFRDVGSLPLVHNDLFRSWFRSLPYSSEAFVEEWRGFGQIIERPLNVPDHRVIARLLRSHAVVSVVGRLAPRTMLVDRPWVYYCSGRDVSQPQVSSTERVPGTVPAVTPKNVEAPAEYGAFREIPPG